MLDYTVKNGEYVLKESLLNYKFATILIAWDTAQFKEIYTIPTELLLWKHGGIFQFGTNDSNNITIKIDSNLLSIKFTSTNEQYYGLYIYGIN